MSIFVQIARAGLSYSAPWAVLMKMPSAPYAMLEERRSSPLSPLFLRTPKESPHLLGGLTSVRGVPQLVAPLAFKKPNESKSENQRYKPKNFLVNSILNGGIAC